LICKLVEARYNISKMMICLSGQHEMVTDFSGFRNFFTLNFITKPIYNAHLMTSKMGDLLVDTKFENENIYAVSTMDEAGNFATLLTYCSQFFEEDIPDIREQVTFEEDISDKTITVYCIDKTHTNPYRLWERNGCKDSDETALKELRQEGKLKPVWVQKGSEALYLDLTPNATYLILVN